MFEGVDLLLVSVLGLTAAVVWFTLAVLHLSPFYVCLGCFIAASCFGVPFGTWKVGPATVSLDRLALAGLMLFGLARWLVTGRPRIQLQRPDWLLLLVLLVFGVSALSRSWSPEYEGDMPPWFRFGQSFLAPALLFWSMRFRPLRDGDGLRLCRFLFFFGLYLAVTAVFERHGPSQLLFPRYMAEPQKLYTGRAMGPFRASPILGTWRTVATAAAIMLAGRSRGLRRLALFAALPLLAYAEYLCLTRSAWLGFCLALPVAVLAGELRLPRSVLACGLALAAVLVALVAGREIMMPERAEGQAVVARSTAQRLALAQRALALFVRSPLLGCGFGQFEHALRHVGSGPIVLASQSAAHGLSSHNLLLRVLAETGLVGFWLLAALYWSWAWRAWQLLRGHRSARTAGLVGPGRTLALLRAALPSARHIDAAAPPLPGDWHSRASTAGQPVDRTAYMSAAVLLCALIAYGSEAMFHDVTHMMIDNLGLFLLAGSLYYEGYRAAAVDNQPAAYTANRNEAYAFSST